MTKNTIILKIVLVLAGLFILFTGLNVALGGIKTMGWQGHTGFVQVADEHTFAIRDSHTRFIGTIWAGVGFMFLFAITDLKKYLPVLQIFCVMIFVGGLARFGQMDFPVLFGSNLIGSLIAELVGMPLLYFWLKKQDA